MDNTHLNRRKFFLTASSAGMVGVGGYLAPSQVDAAVGAASALAGIYPVEQYGAVGNGTTDNTAAFSNAIAAANAAGGGTVVVGPGKYNFLGTLELPPYVALMGTAPGPAEDVSGRNSATLLVSTPASNRNPFIRTNGMTVIQDLAFFYPNQVASGTPIDYPPAILTSRTDNTIRNLYLRNVFRGIYLNTEALSDAGRDLVENIRMGVFGEAGIVVDRTRDVSRLNNIHLWPFYGPASSLQTYARAHTFGILVKHADGLQLNNVFMYGLRGGLVLGVAENGGVSYGQASNLSTDACVYGGVIAYATSLPQGWTLTNLAVACPAGMVAGVNLSPGGFVIEGASPRLNIVGSAMWGSVPGGGWNPRGSASNRLYFTAVTQNDDYIASKVF